MNKVCINPLVERKIAAGIQLLDEKDFDGTIWDNQLVQLVNSSHHLIGTAYLSKQHKGVGWYLGRSVKKLSVSYFVTLFKTAKKKREHFAASEWTNAYRLFNQDGDDFGGLTIDLYKDFALFSWYNVFVYQEKELIIQAFREVFPEVRGAYEKIRFKGPDKETAHLYGAFAPDTFTILENGVAYQVFLNDGLMTGIFLDQHEVRRGLVDGLALGKTVLNLFSYTAAFSVAAAMGGAVETTSVDLAKRSIELSKAHFIQNQLDLSSHQLVVMDVFDYFKYAKRKQLSFDLIIIDPPSFARHKKQTFSVSKDYHQLIAEALDLLAPKGTMIASTNAANMTVNQFKKQIIKGLGGRPLAQMTLEQLPSDFTINKADERSNYLKVFTIRVRE
ncbi:TPA: class I SAM-dependent rRNA methyltransferase [Streptococcus equi subsp. zooepidemicus]|uniref:SAM-dependent methyltransferase n=1 Tax=Streptococcus equi subsp. zooepidemicus Sz4is TaxID=1381082 RepID=A0AAW3GMC4_STRSZ|nr:class I SAM-dependent rRNA methyltransferase [Streptococcus equi]KIS17883.1 SAM-dependent methyltransferase [Streptococcus equi subsp. zooepidemicus Sz4is]HEL1016163.1 class I SAM-dependent rRNA methyltransferase [Streptococcus equi subsp. ruminatorum]KIS07023.1 SAM-dependent methyltransferase [Streptococcus equi subsp. zooepidemicus Sz12is]MCD3381721.1 class I SAM-dependent rRNA methyltransferase [Streptococcus equi subsp. zooepidemicus]MCD3420388.1 class I SAM-dependent rRNA methyltransfe